MGLFIASLNSGSNGNCYYVGNRQEAVLVDVGISCREVETRLLRLGLSISSIKAIFISHEHSDHIRGLSILSQKHQLPVYITPKTLLNGRIALEAPLVFDFSASESISIGALTITSFSKAHDAADPYSFVIDEGDTRVGVFTDIGRPCRQLKAMFNTCTAAFLEANYDEELLRNGNYPNHLKARISGGRGHLSNLQALELFIKHRGKHLNHLILSHLSQNNNCPQLVYNLFNGHANNVLVTIAPRHCETSLFQVCTKIHPALAKRAIRPSQLSFAFG